MNEFLKEWKKQFISDASIGVKLLIIILVFFLILAFIIGIAYLLKLLLGMVAVIIVVPFLVVGLGYLIMTGVSASVELELKKNAKI